MTKRIFIALAIVAGSLCCQPLVRAAEAAESAKSPGSIREHLQQLAADLKLSDEQRTNIQTIVHERLAQLQAARQDASASAAEKMEKVKALRQELAAEIRKVLTPEQLEQWKAKSSRLLGAAQGPLEQLQEALRQLNLSDEQKDKLRSVYQEQMEKLRALRQDTSLSLQAKWEKLQAMRQEITPKVKQVLDPAQFEKWEKSMDQWLESLKQRFQGQE